MNRHMQLCSLCLAIVISSLSGCGTRQFSPTGRELMKPLQTAISAKKPEWIDATEKKMIAESDAGNVSDFEFNALTDIIEQSRAGEWKEAQKALVTLMDAQRATADDVAQLNENRTGKKSRS